MIKKNSFKLHAMSLSKLLIFVFIINLILPIKLVNSAENSNLINNYKYSDDNLDSKPDYWSFYAKGNNYNSYISKDEYKKEPNSLVIDVKKKDSNAIIVHQTVHLTKDQLNKKYKFTQWIKTENFVGAGAHIRLQIVNKSNQRLDIFELSPKVTGSKDWTELSYELDIPDLIGGVEVSGLKIENYISNNSIGKVYFNEPKLICIGNADVDINPDPDVPQYKDSFILNGYFEKVKADGTADKWGKWQSGSNKFNTEVDNKVFFEGKNSIRLENGDKDKTARGTLNQTIRDIPQEAQGKSLKINQWIKTENFNGKGLILRLQYKSPDGQKIEPMGVVNLNVKENMDWTNFNFILDLPKETLGSIVFEYLYDDARGKVWVDNIEVNSYTTLSNIESKESMIKLKKGKSEKINLIFTPSNATNKDVTFESSDKNVAIVNNEGLVTGVNNGVSNIVVKNKESNKKLEIPVIVGESDQITIKDMGTLKGLENKVIKGKIEATSKTGLQLNYTSFTNPKNGTLNLKENGNFEYYPNKNYYGDDIFTVKVSDTNNNFSISNIKVNIEKRNKAPIFENFNITLNENEEIKNKKFNAKDPEGEILKFEIIDKASNGEFIINNNNYSYKPNRNFNGYDSVKIKVIDTFGNEVIAEGNIFVAPSLENIDKLVKKEHPRLLASEDEFNSLRNLVNTDKNAKMWFEKLKIKIDRILTSPVVAYNKPDGLRLDTTASKNIVDLSFMYQITGDKKYADRAWLELENVSVKYPDWSHQHYLDATMTSFGVAIGFDWLYSYLNTEQRATIEKALVKNSLSIGLEYYKNNSHFFVEDKYNWNFVCNTGLTAGALAILGENNDKMAGEIIQEAFKSIQNGLTQYYPEGDSIEGISYWDYGTRYLVYFLSSVSSAIKGENLFINAPGIKETPDYPMFMTGKDGAYNYSDNDRNLPVGYLSLWFANELNRPDLTWYHKYYMSQDEAVVNVYDLLWYKPELYTGESPKELDRAYKERQSVITMRKDWEDPLSSFVGFKGGFNGAPHGDLDIGSFVFDSLGERWALDLGKENYNLPGYWEKEEGGRRWNYYRKRAEGHNTLIINPGSGYDQEVNVHSPIIDMKLNNGNNPYGIIDMTSAYDKEALSVKRGIKFINREDILVRDEYMLKKSGEVAWQMHTDKEVELTEGGKAVILKDGNKRLYVKLLNDGNEKFEIVDAKPYAGSPNPDGQNPNKGIKKLIVKSKGREGNINVWMASFMEGENIPNKVPEVTNLMAWKNESNNDGSSKPNDNNKPEDNSNLENKPNNNQENNKPSSDKNEIVENKNDKDIPKTGQEALGMLLLGLVTLVGAVFIIRK